MKVNWDEIKAAFELVESGQVKFIDVDNYIVTKRGHWVTIKIKTVS